jgi:REP element-mobilizing transposase RayT
MPAKPHPESASPGTADLPIGPPSANQEIGNPSLPKGWHSRGYLPHFDTTAIQHVTLHLADSLPKEVLDRITKELDALPEAERDAEKRKRLDARIDAGHGWCILREPEIARMAQGALHYFAAERYRLLAWVIMPNHMHVLFQPLNGWSLAKIVASWKKFTARGINDWRTTQERQSPDWPSSSLPIWHPEYWDRYMRDEHHFQQTVHYIHQNPVKAGLTAKAQEWLWSSAFTGNANLPIGTSSPEKGNLPIAKTPANQEIGVPTEQP